MGDREGAGGGPVLLGGNCEMAAAAVGECGFGAGGYHTDQPAAADGVT
jgi:hypothetical protein